MHRVSRRNFLPTSASFCVGCALDRSGTEAPSAASVRGPSVGQWWRYAKLNSFSGRLVDNQVVRIAATDGSAHIDSRSEAATDLAKKSWARRWLSGYAARDNPLGPLPSEVQQPWGSVLVDPHWPPLTWDQTMTAHGWESVAIPAGRFTALRFNNLGAHQLHLNA